MSSSGFSRLQMARDIKMNTSIFKKKSIYYMLMWKNPESEINAFPPALAGSNEQSALVPHQGQITAGATEGFILTNFAKVRRFYRLTQFGMEQEPRISQTTTSIINTIVFTKLIYRVREQTEAAVEKLRLLFPSNTSERRQTVVELKLDELWAEMETLRETLLSGEYAQVNTSCMSFSVQFNRMWGWGLQHLLTCSFIQG